MNHEERIAILEQRIADAEARIARLEAEQYDAPAPPPSLFIGCVCPPGAEFGCQSSGCPRRGFSVWPTCGAST